jgi:FHA domain
MKLLRQEVGNPSLSSLVRHSGNQLSKSTLDDHISSRRTQLPSWRLLAAYVSACHAAAESTGIDIEEFETLDEWRVRWLSALRGDESTTVSTYTVSLKELEDLSKAQDDYVSKQGIYGYETEHAGEVTDIMIRLEEDLSKLGNSLPHNIGLLVVLSGPNVGTRFAVEHNIVTVGRNRVSDIPLDHGTVSRNHAKIRRYNDYFTIMDIGSSNGTFLRQQRLDRDDEVPLNTFDELQVGIFKLLFVQGGNHR